MLKKLCPYHKGPMKHTLEECTILRRCFSRQDPPKGDTEKKAAGGKDDDEQKDDGFPKVQNCFMIFGVPLMRLTTRQRKCEH
jgi:hypothetical protein